MKLRLAYIIPILFTGTLSFSQNGFSDKIKTSTGSQKHPSVSKTINGKVNAKEQTLVNNQDLFSKIHEERKLGIKSKYKPNKKTPSWLSISNLSDRPTPSKTMDQTALSKSFLKDVKSKMGTSNHSSFSLLKNGNNSSRFIQKYEGIEIYGSEVIVHFNKKGQAESLNGEFHACDTELDLTTSVLESDAISLVIENIKENGVYKELGRNESKFLQTSAPSIKKVVYPLPEQEDKFVTAYEISLHSNALDHWYYVIDANTGDILNKYNQLCSVGTLETATATDLDGISRSINTYLDGGTYYLADASKPMFDPSDESGLIITLDANNTSGDNPEYITSTNNTWNNRSAISGHINAGIAYDYFQENHDRNSIDGEGGDILSIVNLTDEDGNGLDNAYWNGQAIFYGNGDEVFSPLAGAVDVAGHEMSHGVVQNTANLVYQNEPGAINESMADIFGVMMDSTDWQIGEDITSTSYIASGALRDMQDPHNGGSSIFDAGYQPKHVNEQYNGSEDNGGVHINSGIPNHAFYLLATDINSRSTAAAIFYRALENYLTRSSDFIDLRASCIQSAKDLHGENSSIVESVRTAFSDVGIIGDDEIVINTGGEIEQNEGDEHLISLDTDVENVNTLYDANLEENTIGFISQTSVNNKPSVTDNGASVYFITGNKNIHEIDLSDPNQTEYIIDDSQFWDNVAVSKDGSKLAAISIEIDTAIYIIDLQTGDIGKYTLYNPTFTQGVTSGGPLYADAIEWDYTGENVIYDAYNEIQTTGGDNIEYWDVGIINVWNNDANDFGSGEIEKLFTSLPEDVSIGNPSFSKNSNNIVAFDYFDTANDEYAVIGYNIDENELDVLYENNTLGWPSYNQQDDRVAYTTYRQSYENILNFNNTIIQYVELNDDKISAKSTPVDLIPYATYGVYYTVGDRNVLSTDELESKVTTDLINIFPNPFNETLTIKTGLNEFVIEILDLNGKSLITQQNLKTIETESLEKGIYFMKLSTNNYTKTVKIIKE